MAENTHRMEDSPESLSEDSSGSEDSGEDYATEETKTSQTSQKKEARSRPGRRRVDMRQKDFQWGGFNPDQGMKPLGMFVGPYHAYAAMHSAGIHESGHMHGPWTQGAVPPGFVGPHCTCCFGCRQGPRGAWTASKQGRVFPGPGWFPHKRTAAIPPRLRRRIRRLADYMEQSNKSSTDSDTDESNEAQKNMETDQISHSKRKARMARMLNLMTYPGGQACQRVMNHGHQPGPSMQGRPHFPPRLLQRLRRLVTAMEQKEKVNSEVPVAEETQTRVALHNEGNNNNHPGVGTGNSDSVSGGEKDSPAVKTDDVSHTRKETMEEGKRKQPQHQHQPQFGRGMGARGPLGLLGMGPHSGMFCGGHPRGPPGQGPPYIPPRLLQRLRRLVFAKESRESKDTPPMNRANEMQNCKGCSGVKGEGYRPGPVRWGCRSGERWTDTQPAPGPPHIPPRLMFRLRRLMMAMEAREAELVEPTGTERHEANSDQNVPCGPEEECSPTRATVNTALDTENIRCSTGNVENYSGTFAEFPRGPPPRCRPDVPPHLLHGLRRLVATMEKDEINHVHGPETMHTKNNDDMTVPNRTNDCTIGQPSIPNIAEVKCCGMCPGSKDKRSYHMDMPWARHPRRQGMPPRLLYRLRRLVAAMEADKTTKVENSQTVDQTEHVAKEEQRRERRRARRQARLQGLLEGTGHSRGPGIPPRLLHRLCRQMAAMEADGDAEVKGQCAQKNTSRSTSEPRKDKMPGSSMSTP